MLDIKLQDRETPNQKRYNDERKEQVDKRKEEILQVAEKLFLENGMVNTTMVQIAKGSNINKATLYRYFSSKDEIAFLIATKIMMGIKVYKENYFEEYLKKETRKISEKEKNIITLKGIIDDFEILKNELKYLSMFDGVYSGEYPNEYFADEYLKTVVGEKHNKRTEEEEEIILYNNLIMSYLEKMARRGEKMTGRQGVSLKKQLDILIVKMDKFL